MANSTLPPDRRTQALASIRESQARMAELRKKTLLHTSQLGKTAEKLRAGKTPR